MILLASNMGAICKYVLHTIDAQRTNPWEQKSTYMFYVDLLVGTFTHSRRIPDFVKDFFKLVTYVAFFAVILHYYGLPIHIIRDLYITLRNFVGRVKDWMQYRRATSNMNERYPTATEQELLQGDNTCIICREEMTVQEDPKKLPCGHIFHFRCLRSWLERQQSCPTCRRSVFPGEQGRFHVGHGCVMVGDSERTTDARARCCSPCKPRRCATGCCGPGSCSCSW